jgi:hypothetical protein
VAAIAIGGCATQPETGSQRVLIDAHAPEFVDRVLANPAFDDFGYGPEVFRQALEADGRA